MRLRKIVGQNITERMTDRYIAYIMHFTSVTQRFINSPFDCRRLATQMKLKYSRIPSRQMQKHGMPPVHAKRTTSRTLVLLCRHRDSIMRENRCGKIVIHIILYCHGL